MRARPYLERAWTHYVFRVGNANPTIFHRWLMSVRDRNLQTPFGIFRFTISHYDFLLAKLLSFLNLTPSKKSDVKLPNVEPSATSTPQIPSRTPKRVKFADERPSKPHQTNAAQSVELRPQKCSEKSKSCTKSKRKCKTKISKANSIVTKDLESIPDPVPAPDPVPTRSAKRSKVQVPIAPPKTIRLDENTHDTAPTRSDDDDSSSVRTLSTLSDNIELPPRKRLKRAIVRFIVHNREACSCHIYSKLKAGDVSIIPDALIEDLVNEAVPKFDHTRRLTMFAILGDIIDRHPWCACRNCYAQVIGGLSAYSMIWSSVHIDP